MEQRPLRLGDIVDDYCPRERRITNHAIVALVGEDIRQTRCGTCDTEHVFKGGQLPKRTTLRKKDGDAAGQLVSARPAVESALGPPVPMAAASPGPPSSPPGPASPVADDLAADPAGHAVASGDDHVDGWLAHRPLIRATLPRTEGDVPTPRPIPEFTMHQRQTRGSRAFRQSYGWSGGTGNQANGFRHGRQVDGNVAGNGNHDRHGRHGHGNGQGQGHGNGNGQGRGQHGHGGGRPGRHRAGKHHNKRSR